MSRTVRGCYIPSSDIKSTPQQRKTGWLLPLLRRKPHRGRSRVVRWIRRKLDKKFHPVGVYYIPQTICSLRRDKSYRGRPLESQASTFRAIKSIHKQVPRNQSQNFTSKRGHVAVLKNGVWFSSKFSEELAVQAPISLDDALHRASYFATHEEEVATLKEQYSTNKNNVTKKTTDPKEPVTKGQHSYVINNSP